MFNLINVGITLFKVGVGGIVPVGLIIWGWYVIQKASDEVEGYSISNGISWISAGIFLFLISRAFSATISLKKDSNIKVILVLWILAGLSFATCVIFS